jgi:PAS domain S-box-containing protein
MSSSARVEETLSTDPADLWDGLRPLVDQLLKGISTAVDADRATVTRIEGSSVVIEGSFDASGAAAISGQRWEITDPEMRRLIASQQPLVQLLDPATLPSPFREQLADVRHMVIFPLSVLGKVFGTVTVSRRQDPPFGERDLAVLQDLGDVAVVALRDAIQMARAQALSSELQSSEERFRLFVEGVKDYAIFMLNPSGQVTSWNEGAERIKGYRADEIIGRHISTFYVPEDVASRKPARALAVARQRGRYEEEGWRLRRDGSRFMANVLITAIHDESGQLQGFAKVTRDITERRRLQDKLLKAQRREAARFRELADQMAILERTKSQFLDLASHELRTPVSLIRGYLSLFEEGVLGELNENGHTAISVLNGQMLQLHFLIDQMLHAAGLKSRSLALHEEDFDLRELVATVVEWAHELAGGDIKVTLSAPSHPVPVRADRDWLSTILHNLLDNAIKYSPFEGSIDCELLSDGRWAKVKIKDQGPGLDPDQLSQLFQEFGRVVNPDTAAIRGAGLGLYLARELARLHRGDVIVESEPRHGSTFVLVLPLANR